jgi:hypothetical protein
MSSNFPNSLDDDSTLPYVNDNIRNKVRRVKTVGWNTRCTCGTVIVTKQNSLKLHKSKVQKHVELAQS